MSSAPKPPVPPQEEATAAPKVELAAENLENPLVLASLEPDAKPWYKTPHLIKLHLLMGAWGFDIAMTNALQSLDSFNEKFGHPQGERLGFYGSSTQLGGAFTILVAPFIIQRFGRRWMVFIGAVLIVAMAVMETCATSFEMFVAGKLLLGFGSTAAQIAAPVLVTELCHPRYRARVTSMYNTTIYIGLIIGAWIAYGTQDMPGDWSWRIPCILQVVLPTYQILTVFLCPESPRWLVARGREAQARKILATYHGGGVETPLVRAEMEAIIAGVEADATSIRFNRRDLAETLRHRGNQHRLFIATVVAVGSQCLGSSLISSYLPAILDTVGLKSTREKTLINGIINIFSWLVGIGTSYFLPQIRKRFIFLFATAGMILTFVVWTALAAMYSENGDRAYGIGVVAMIFIFNGFNATCWLPLVIAYPLELATTKQRGLFFSWMFFALSISSFAVNYINPVGLANLSWRYYIVTIAFDLLVLVIIYFSFVETKGMSLEEIATIFDGRETFGNAVSAVHAIEAKTDAMAAQGQVDEVEVEGEKEKATKKD